MLVKISRSFVLGGSLWGCDQGPHAYVNLRRPAPGRQRTDAAPLGKSPMKNLREIAKAAADKLAQAVEKNPGLKKVAERIQTAVKETAVETATNMATSLHRATSRRDNNAGTAAPDSEQPAFADRAKNLFKKLPPIPIEVSEAQLNELAADAIADDSRIKSLNIKCRQDRLTVTGTLRLIGLPFNFTTQLSLESCELSPRRKVITLRRLDDIAISGKGMLASFMAYVVKIVICGLFGVDLAAISLKGIKGLTINKELITADLEAMGVVDAILTGLREKIRQRIELLPGGPLVRIAVEPMLTATGPLLLSKLHLQNVATADKGINGEVVLAKP